MFVSQHKGTVLSQLLQGKARDLSMPMPIGSGLPSVTCPTHSSCEINASFVLLLEANVGRFAVQTNAKAFQLVFNYLLMPQGFQDIQNDEDQVTGSGH